MNLSIAYLTLLGLTGAHAALLGRQSPPYKETPPSKLLANAVRAGIPRWGLLGLPGQSRNKSPAPIKNMPGGLPELRRPKPGSSDWRSDTLKGPRKKPGTSFPKDTACVKRGICQFRVPKAIRRASVFMVIAPYIHSVLECIKQSDNAVGESVKWFDDAMARLQESIGGPQRDDIYGNELKKDLIDFVKSVFSVFGQSTYDIRQRLAVEAAAKESARRQEEQNEIQRLKGLAELSHICEQLTMNADGPDSQLSQSCAELAAEVEMIEDLEAEEAEGKTEPERYIWFGKCKCSTHDPFPSSNECALQCQVVSIILSLILPDSEPDRICSDSKGEFQCQGEQTHLELKTGHAICGACGFAWDIEGGKCRNKTGHLIWPLQPSPDSPDPPGSPYPPDFPDSLDTPDSHDIPSPELLTSGQTAAELWTGLAICSICRGGWDEEGSQCRSKIGEPLWPRKVSRLTPGVIPPDPSASCMDSTHSIRCGGGQTTAELEAGFAICGVCGFAWDVEGGKCRGESGQVIWPPPEPEPLKTCSGSSGDMPCGREQTAEELEAGLTVCEVCRGTWNAGAGTCRGEKGALFWPPKS